VLSPGADSVCICAAVGSSGTGRARIAGVFSLPGSHAAGWNRLHGGGPSHPAVGLGVSLANGHELRPPRMMKPALQWGCGLVSR